MIEGSPSKNPYDFLRDPFGRIPLSPLNCVPQKKVCNFVKQAQLRSDKASELR